MPIGPWVGTRRHTYTWDGNPHDQYERYFVARSPEFELAPTAIDTYVIGHRWGDCRDPGIHRGFHAAKPGPVFPANPGG